MKDWKEEVRRIVYIRPSSMRDAESLAEEAIEIIEQELDKAREEGARRYKELYNEIQAYWIAEETGTMTKDKRKKYIAISDEMDKLTKLKE